MNEEKLETKPIHFGWLKENISVWYRIYNETKSLYITDAEKYWLNLDKDYSPEKGCLNQQQWLQYLKELKIKMNQLLTIRPGKNYELN